MFTQYYFEEYIHFLISKYKIQVAMIRNMCYIIMLYSFNYIMSYYMVLFYNIIYIYKHYGIYRII